MKVMQWMLLLIGVGIVLLIISNVSHIVLWHKAMTALSTSSLSSSSSGQPLRQLQHPLMQLESLECNKSKMLMQKIEQLTAEKEDLQSTVASLSTQLKKCQQRLKRRGCESVMDGGSSTMEGQDTSATISAETNSSSSYCSVFQSSESSTHVPSTLSLWNSQLRMIVEASQHELDKRFVLHDFTAQLLHLVSPDRLARSTMALPHEWTPVQRAFNKLYQRHLFLTSQQQQQKMPNGEDHQSTAAPKLKILVMGGSLIVGVNCRKIVSDYSLSMQMPNRLCTWTHRLETFLNKMMGGDYVEVHKIALGGTNTQTGFVMWDSNFLPEETRDPDILLNAYSTNDMHILTVLQAKEGNQTLRDKVLEMTQDFVRSVLSSSSCSSTQPLLMHMDDYLGNEQREILTTMELSQAVAALTSYYGFSSVSYANVVRDLVYGDTHESWISPQGWYEPPTSNEMLREIHPGMGMHIISTWVAAYNLLHLATTYCAIEPMLLAAANKGKAALPHEERVYDTMNGIFPPLRNNPVIAGKPKGRPLGLPPKLVPSLSLENITELWHAAKPLVKCDASDDNSDNKNSGDNTPKCPFSWFSGLSKQGLNETYAHDLFTMTDSNSVGGVLVENTGWDTNTAGKKLGISPKATSQAAAILKFRLEPGISTITLFYMKSYGPQWTDSTLSIRIDNSGSPSPTLTQGDQQQRQEHSLVGYHDKQTSETYTHRMDIQDMKNPHVFTLTHTRGKTFKIMGLAICK